MASYIDEYYNITPLCTDAYINFRMIGEIYDKDKDIVNELIESYDMITAYNSQIYSWSGDGNIPTGINRAKDKLEKIAGKLEGIKKQRNKSATTQP